MTYRYPRPVLDRILNVWVALLAAFLSFIFLWPLLNYSFDYWFGTQ